MISTDDLAETERICRAAIGNDPFKMGISEIRVRESVLSDRMTAQRTLAMVERIQGLEQELVVSRAAIDNLANSLYDPQIYKAELQRANEEIRRLRAEKNKFDQEAREYSELRANAIEELQHAYKEIGVARDDFKKLNAEAVDLRIQLERTRELMGEAEKSLEKCMAHVNLDDTNWNNLSALAFASRCGLVDIEARDALNKLRAARGG